MMRGQRGGRSPVASMGTQGSKRSARGQGLIPCARVPVRCVAAFCSKYDVVLPILVAMNFWSTLVVPFVLSINANGWRARRWLWLYAPYQLLMLSVPAYLCVQHTLPIASGLIVMCEMVRPWCRDGSTPFSCPPAPLHCRRRLGDAQCVCVIGVAARRHDWP